MIFARDFQVFTTWHQNFKVTPLNIHTKSYLQLNSLLSRLIRPLIATDYCFKGMTRESVAPDRSKVIATIISQYERPDSYIDSRKLTSKNVNLA